MTQADAVVLLDIAARGGLCGARLCRSARRRCYRQIDDGQLGSKRWRGANGRGPQMRRGRHFRGVLIVLAAAHVGRISGGLAICGALAGLAQPGACSGVRIKILGQEPWQVAARVRITARRVRCLGRLCWCWRLVDVGAGRQDRRRSDCGDCAGRAAMGGAALLFQTWTEGPSDSAKAIRRSKLCHPHKKTRTCAPVHSGARCLVATHRLPARILCAGKRRRINPRSANCAAGAASPCGMLSS